MKKAFTLIELILVITVIGILSKFGVDLLMQSYQNAVYSSVQNRLQEQTQATLMQLANRLEFRIKESVIAQTSSSFKPLSSSDGNETILAWIGTDRASWLGSWDGSYNKPLFSGVIDVDNANADSTTLISPETNTTAINDVIDVLSYGDSDINDAAIFFIGSNTDVISGFGWDGVTCDQNDSIHPIEADGTFIDRFRPKSGSGTFSGVDVYEYYYLSWSAYAVALENSTLTLYYDFQPWQGEKYSDGKSAILMEDIETFQFRAVGDLIKIQICVTDSDIFSTGAYSVCKEKTIF